MNQAVVNLIALSTLVGGPLVALGVGVAYFVKAEQSAALWLRLISSAFGPCLALLFLVAGFLWPEQHRYNSTGVKAYYWLQLLPLALLGLALIVYPGNRRLHFVLVPLGLVAWACTFAWGWLLVHGE